MSQPTASPILLLIEDDESMRFMARQILEGAGFEVVEAPNGTAGLQRFHLAQPDVVLLDVMMPGLSGFEVAQQLRAHEAATGGWTPIMMLTALSDVKDKVRGLEAGADDFLTKPFSRYELLARIQALLRLKRLHRQLTFQVEAVALEQEELARHNATLRRVLGRYLSQSVAEQVLANPTSHLRLGGASRRVSVLFADIRGFTRFSDGREAQAVLLVLNRIWDRLVPLVFDHDGTFDKLMGDGLMAFFGAPLASLEAPRHAVEAALAMQRAFELLCQSDALLAELGLGVGIVTGEALVGNVGSVEAMDYTVIGSVPNSAKRLEEQAQRGQTLICAETFAALEGKVVARPLPPLLLKGRREPLAAFEALAAQPPAAPVRRRLLARLAPTPTLDEAAEP